MHGAEDEAEREERARTHPTRAAILALFAEDDTELSAAEIRSRLSGETSLRDLYYHLRVLVACRLLAESGDRYEPA